MKRIGRGAAALSLTLGLLAAPPVAAQSLQETVARAAAAWHRGDAGAITALAAPAGISLDIDGGSVGPLGPRQAAAVLRRVFDGRESVAVRPTLVRPVSGDPPRAFGELTWYSRARGTTIPDEAKLFVALARDGGRWHITEIRLLR